ncbi:uncharacterized protein BDW47DRAFT_121678 [Aspergillus candidus]|uniref:Uncharacterized protein n=1 Tax=Aspergillus candidus TaxID=41067 RepID=A0A2I2FPL8_ASPCN|nr:hypothetical protein BDW47DRAFT_121678 [Aspergillus candidus]PLB42578.1 hypothetical protein BDW47DRAFT_121678 [Aspergillus candidus]
MPRLVTPCKANANLLKYDGYGSFVTSLRENLNTGREVLQFACVSAQDFEAISSDNHRPLMSAKLSYDFLTGVLTVKMPGFAHETLTGLFKAMVDKKLIMMDVFDETTPRASPLTVMGNLAKEPDACWAPYSTDDLTVVLEVRASESTARLAVDARGWLETPGSTVTTCITINLSRENNIIIEVWRLGTRVYAVSSRSSPSPAVRVQHVEILNGEAGSTIRGWKTDRSTNTIPTDKIQLDFNTFVGRPAATDLECDIVIDNNLLTAFACRFWDLQSRRLQG